MIFKVTVTTHPVIHFPPDIKIDCVGEPLFKVSEDYATIIGYQIYDGKLILECETKEQTLIYAIESGILTGGNMEFKWDPVESKNLFARLHN